MLETMKMFVTNELYFKCSNIIYCSKNKICALLADYNIVQFYFVTFCVLILVVISYGYIIFCFNFCVIMLVNDGSIIFAG